MTEWELTDEEINKVVQAHLKTERVNDVAIQDCNHLACHAIAAAAQKKLLDHLAARCGEKPCEKCEHKETCLIPQNVKQYGGMAKRVDLPANRCDSFHEHLGQQSGYAKCLAEAESKVKAREQEIVEWLKTQKSIPPEDVYYQNPEYYHGRDDTIAALESWLNRGGEGMR